MEGVGGDGVEGGCKGGERSKKREKTDKLKRGDVQDNPHNYLRALQVHPGQSCWVIERIGTRKEANGIFWSDLM